MKTRDWIGYSKTRVVKVRKVLYGDSESEHLEQDIIDILHTAQVEFDRESLKIDKLTGGTSNDIYRVEILPDAEILFRIYGTGIEQFIDRKQELENMRLLSEFGLGANVVAEFENGIAYQFITGKSINITDALSEDIYPLIAQKLARFHQVPVMNKQNALWLRIEKFINLVPDFHEDIVGNGMFRCKQDLIKEFNFLKNILEDCDSPLVFCHLDLNLPNIVYDGTDVHFIDVEYAGCSHPAFDIANHFVEFSKPKNIEIVSSEEKKLDSMKIIPSREFRLAWIRAYFDAITDTYTEAEVDAFYELVQKFVLCSHLMWGAWSLVQASVSKINFDFKESAQQRLREYARMKNSVINS